MKVLLLILVATVLGAADGPKVDPADPFTWGERIVHPFALKKFDCWLSDTEPPVAAIVLQASLDDTNEYSDPVERREVDGRQGKLRIVDGDEKEEKSGYGYRVIGRLENGIHVVETLDGTRRTVYHELKLLELGDLPIQVGQETREYDVLVLRALHPLGDRFAGTVTIDGNVVVVTTPGEEEAADKVKRHDYADLAE